MFQNVIVLLMFFCSLGFHCQPYVHFQVREGYFDGDCADLQCVICLCLCVHAILAKWSMLPYGCEAYFIGCIFSIFRLLVPL
jgi:hypothetical protein